MFHSSLSVSALRSHKSGSGSQSSFRLVVVAVGAVFATLRGSVAPGTFSPFWSRCNVCNWFMAVVQLVAQIPEDPSPTLSRAGRSSHNA